MELINSKQTFLQKVYLFMFPKFFRDLNKTKKIAYLGVFIALAVVVNIFSFPFGLGNSNKLSFVSTVAFLTGSIFGCGGGFLIMFLGDLIGFIFDTSGSPYNILIGLGSGMMGFIYGIIMVNVKFNFKGEFIVKTIISYIISFIICTCILNSLGNYLYVVEFIWKGQMKKTFIVYTLGRITAQSIVCTINLFASYILSFSLDKIPQLKLDITREKARKEEREKAVENQTQQPYENYANDF